jgi:hypothetical protein
MSFRLKDLKMFEWRKLLWPFGAVFLIGLLLRIYYPACWFAPDAFHTLSDAFMVSGIVGFLVDVFAYKILMEKVSEDIAQRLVGRYLPTEVQAHIQKITATERVWSNYVKRYSLSLLGDKMLVSAEVSFEVRNYSGIATDYSPLISEESFYQPKFLYVEYGLNDKAPTIFNEEKLKSLEELVSGSEVRKVDRFPPIKLPPLREKKFARVLMRFQLTMPVEYTDLTHFAGATTGVKIVLQTIPEGFAFSAEGEQMLHSPEGLSWDFLGPFVGGQHVRVRWFKKAK